MLYLLNSLFVMFYIMIISHWLLNSSEKLFVSVYFVAFMPQLKKQEGTKYFRFKKTCKLHLEYCNRTSDIFCKESKHSIAKRRTYIHFFTTKQLFKIREELAKQTVRAAIIYDFVNWWEKHQNKKNTYDFDFPITLRFVRIEVSFFKMKFKKMLNNHNDHAQQILDQNLFYVQKQHQSSLDFSCLRDVIRNFSVICLLITNSLFSSFWKWWIGLTFSHTVQSMYFRFWKKLDVFNFHFIHIAQLTNYF